jgi:hypothetical protein
VATFRKRASRWHVQVRRLGHSSITRTFRHKADAVAWARKLDVEIDRGEVSESRRPLKGQSLSDLLTRYKTTVSPKKKGSLQERYRLDQLLRHAIANTQLDQLTPGVVAVYRNKRLDAVQGVTVRRELALLRHVIETARREWGVPVANNPVAMIKIPPPTQARTRRVIGDELDRLLVECRGRGNTLLAAAIVLAVETGTCTR